MTSLTSNRAYPPMSHPVADPSVNAVAARFAGLEPPDPARSRILEIGCATGHHLLPLAMRWPLARFTGIDARSMGSGCAFHHFRHLTPHAAGPRVGFVRHFRMRRA